GVNSLGFPWETTLGFVLVGIFVLCGSALFYGEFQGAMETDKTAKQCVSKALLKLSKLESSLADNSGNAGTGLAQTIAHCVALMRPGVICKIGGIALVILVATLHYRLYPIWKLRTAGLGPINVSDLPELHTELHGIVQTARLPHPLVFVWNPLATGLPIVFGRRDSYYVALSGLFISHYFYRDKDAFRAIMLHELAHIHNGDVSKAHLTMSLWLAFVTTALAPSLIISAWHLANFRLSDAVYLVLIGILWAGIIVLSGLSVLRAREYYADVRASVWSQT